MRQSEVDCSQVLITLKMETNETVTQFPGLNPQRKSCVANQTGRSVDRGDAGVLF